MSRANPLDDSALEQLFRGGEVNPENLFFAGVVSEDGPTGLDHGTVVQNCLTPGGNAEESSCSSGAILPLAQTRDAPQRPGDRVEDSDDDGMLPAIRVRVPEAALKDENAG